MKSRYINTEMRRVLRWRMSADTRLIIDLIEYTGFRVGDIVRIRAADVAAAKHAKGILRLTEQKTHKERAVRLCEDLLKELKIRAHGKQPQDYIFPHRTRPHAHRTTSAIRMALKRSAKEFGIDARGIGTHSFRKVYAVRKFAEYGNIEDLQKDMKHSNPMLTAYYALSDKHQRVKPAQAPAGLGLDASHQDNID